MAEKQLEIIIKARDQASSVLGQVGESAKGTGDKLGSLDKLAEAGHGLHKMLRTAEHIGIAFEVGNLGVAAAEGVYKSFTGSAEEAAAGQRALFEAIKEIPVVGSIVAPALENISAHFAHMFGSESTAEVEEGEKKAKSILEDFAKYSAKFEADLQKEDEAAKMISLLPGEAAMEKAKDQYASKIEEINEFKKQLLAKAQQEEATGAATGWRGSGLARVFGFKAADLHVEAGDYQRELAQIRQMEDAAQKVEAGQQAEAHAKELEETREFNQSLEDLTKSRIESIEGLQEQLDQQSLEDQGRVLEAKLAKIREDGDKEIAAAKDSAEKQQQEIQKKISELQPAAAAGNRTAQQRIEDLSGKSGEVSSLEKAQENLINQKTKQLQNDARDVELKKTQTDLLQEQADAGDKDAKAQLEKLRIADDINQKQAALNAILNDSASTDDQKKQANQELLELTQQQAALEKTKDQAALDALDKRTAKVQQAQQKKDLSEQKKDDKKQDEPQLAELASSQFLTGVSERMSQPSQPVVDKLDQVHKSIGDVVEFLKGALAPYLTKEMQRTIGILT